MSNTSLADTIRRNAGIAAIAILLAVVIGVCAMWISAAIDPTFKIPTKLIVETPWAVALVAMFTLTAGFAFLALQHTWSSGAIAGADDAAQLTKPPNTTGDGTTDGQGDLDTAGDHSGVTTVGDSGRSAGTSAGSEPAEKRANQNFPDDLTEGGSGNERRGAASPGQPAPSPGGPTGDAVQSETGNRSGKPDARGAAGRESGGIASGRAGAESEQTRDRKAGNHTAEDTKRYYRNRSTRVVQDTYKR
mgnify:CR=1 FL=1